MTQKFDSRRLILIPTYLTSAQSGRVARLLISVAGRDQLVRLLEYSIMLVIFLLTKTRGLFDEEWRMYWSYRLLTSVVALNSSRKLFRVGYFVQIVCFGLIEQVQRKIKDKVSPKRTSVDMCDTSASGTLAECGFNSVSSKDVLRVCLIVKSVANDIHILTKKKFLGVFNRYENSFLLSYFSTILLKIVILGSDVWSIVQSAKRSPFFAHEELVKRHGGDENINAPDILEKKTCDFNTKWKKFRQVLMNSLRFIGETFSAAIRLATTQNMYQKRILFKGIDLLCKITSIIFRLFFGEFRSIPDIPLGRIGQHVHLPLITCGMISSACKVAETYLME